MGLKLRRPTVAVGQPTTRDASTAGSGSASAVTDHAIVAVVAAARLPRCSAAS